MDSQPDAVPAPTLDEVRAQFDAWRATRPSGHRIPDHLWALALSLLASHSASEVAGHLGLHSERLRRRHAQARAAGQQPQPRRPDRTPAQSPPVFLELTPDALATHARRTGAEVRLVVERADGLRLSLLADATAWPRLEALVRSVLAS